METLTVKTGVACLVLTLVGAAAWLLGVGPGVVARMVVGVGVVGVMVTCLVWRVR